jgi:hypothetical protein
MPRLAANLSLMFTELAFLDRFAAAGAVGFQGVEFLFLYGWPAKDIRVRLHDAGLVQVLFNISAGDFAGGERGRRPRARTTLPARSIRRSTMPRCWAVRNCMRCRASLRTAHSAECLKLTLRRPLILPRLLVSMSLSRRPTRSTCPVISSPTRSRPPTLLLRSAPRALVCSSIFITVIALKAMPRARSIATRGSHGTIRSGAAGPGRADPQRSQRRRCIPTHRCERL